MDKAVMSVRMKKWAGILQEAATSGLTKTEFCTQNGIDRRQFFHWQKKSANMCCSRIRNWDFRHLMDRCSRSEQ